MAKGGKQHLKSALQSQQSRLKAKRKLSQAAQVLQQKAKKTGKGGAQPNVASGSGLSQAPVKSKGKGKEKAVSTGQLLASSAKPVIPFKPSDKILLIGEGNFSFARALVVDPPPEIAHLPPGNVIATTYDSEEDCYSKYTDAQEIVAGLRERGVKVLFGVDGTKLERVAGIKGKKFDKIMFNFPHAGKGISDQDRNILSNQLLILGFLSSASKFLTTGPVPVAFRSRKRKRPDDEEESGDDVGSEDEDAMDHRSSAPSARGTVLITLRNVVPYTQWDVPRLAKNPPPPPTASAAAYSRYTLLRSFRFHRPLWKGYEHKMTKGERAHGTGKTGEGGEDRTWEFYLSDVDRDGR